MNDFLLNSYKNVHERICSANFQPGIGIGGILLILLIVD